ncbi:MAG: ATP-binding protein [Candidatus Omnitrophica bacterium]|nr:ATP-binding protein [Candidatus Omnitrophota bacterium]
MKIYPRKILQKIKKFLNTPEIIVIHGARQVGKTTLLHMLMQEIQRSSPPSNIVFFDLEDFELTELCNRGVKAVVEHLKAKGCNFNQKIWLFIDEIQYLENPSSFLKYFFDHYKDKIKLIVSGSSSFALKSKFKESLVGRTFNFELFGLDFEEFLVFKNLNYDLSTTDKIVTEELKKLFLEYLFYSSYPRVILEDSLEIKKSILKQIINTYIKKDIKDLAKIANIDKFNKLLRIIASQSANLINILELANTCGISRQTLENYLMILENTYIIRRISPFYCNLRSELTKMSKVYFEDLGIKHILEKGDFPNLLEGPTLETGIFSILRKNIETENIHFWRTTRKQEIDFILDLPQGLFAFETKINLRNKDGQILSAFKKKYPGAQTYLVGLNFVDKKQKIKFLYPWQILKILG